MFAGKSRSRFAVRSIKLFARQGFFWAAVKSLLDQPINDRGAEAFIKIKTALNPGNGLLA